jgi:hypothetical protein
MSGSYFGVQTDANTEVSESFVLTASAVGVDATPENLVRPINFHTASLVYTNEDYADWHEFRINDVDYDRGHETLPGNAQQTSSTMIEYAGQKIESLITSSAFDAPNSGGTFNKYGLRVNGIRRDFWAGTLDGGPPKFDVRITRNQNIVIVVTGTWSGGVRRFELDFGTVWNHNASLSTIKIPFRTSFTVANIRDSRGTQLIVARQGFEQDLTPTSPARSYVFDDQSRVLGYWPDLTALSEPFPQDNTITNTVCAMSATSTVTAQNSRVRRAWLPNVTAAEFTSAGHMLKSISSTIGIFGGVTSNGVDTGVKSTISFWSKIQSATPFDVLMSRQADGGYTRIIIKPVTVNGVQVRRVIFNHANSNLGAGNASLQWSWDITATDDWRHYLLLVDDTRFSGFGSPRLARLFVNGVPQGQKSSPMYSISPRLESPSFAIGYNPYQSQQAQFWGSGPYTTEQNNTTNSQLAQLWIGRMFHSYVNNIPSGLAQFYQAGNNGYVALNPNGSTASGVTPQIFVAFTPQESGITISQTSGSVSLLRSGPTSSPIIGEFTVTADLTEFVEQPVIVAAQATSTVTAVISRTRSATANIQSAGVVTVTAQAQRLGETVLAAEFTVNSAAQRARTAESDIDSEFALTAQAQARRQAQAELSTAASMTVESTVFQAQQFQADLSAEFTVTAEFDVVITQTFEAALSAEFASTAQARRQRLAQAQLNSQVLVQSAADIKKNAQAILSATVAVAAQSQKIATGTAALTVAATMIVDTTIFGIDQRTLLIIQPESRMLTISPETRLLEIEQETRILEL